MLIPNLAQKLNPEHLAIQIAGEVEDMYLEAQGRAAEGGPDPDIGHAPVALALLLDIDSIHPAGQQLAGRDLEVGGGKAKSAPRRSPGTTTPVAA